MESPDRRPGAPEGLRGRLYENLDIVDAALPSVSCLPRIPVSISSLCVTIICCIILCAASVKISRCTHTSLDPEHKTSACTQSFNKRLFNSLWVKKITGLGYLNDGSLTQKKGYVCASHQERSSLPSGRVFFSVQIVDVKRMGQVSAQLYSECASHHHIKHLAWDSCTSSANK